MTSTAPLRRIVLESPFKGSDGNYAENREYARLAVKHSLAKDEAPIASHLLYTQPGILDDTDDAERIRGMAAGHRWIGAAECVVFYCDRGMSRGMIDAEKIAKAQSIPTEYRFIERDVADPVAERAKFETVP